MAIQTALSLNTITLPVNLGVTDEERLTPQNIVIDVTIYLNQVPEACFSDNIDDTFCYYKVFTTIEDICSNESFNLIEHLCYKIHISVKKLLHNSNIKVRVQKTYPPISDRMESASFEYDDR